MNMSYEGPERRKHDEEFQKDFKQVKRYSVSSLGISAAQLAAIIWWASGINSDVTVLKNANLVERVIKMEAVMEEHNRFLTKLNSTLDDLNKTIDYVAKEQVRRSSTIDRVEEHLKGKHR